MKKANKDALRAMVLEKTFHYWNEVEGEDTLPVSTGAFSMPVTSLDGEEGYATITVTMRDKDRQGNAYDGYAESEAFLAEQAENAEAAKVRAENKARLDAEKEARRLEREAKKLAKEQKAQA